ncbi:MAG: glycosyl hydrolase 115 family protein, partial [Undibacterium sp.]|nr:glycosyl hydrolase 115 family protein [Opitutaceae bacterium]
MLETVLRLKYDTFELGSVADLRPDAPRYAVQPEAAKAHARGLVITHHHRSPLGSNLSSWGAFWRREGKEVPPLSVRDPEKLKTFWRYHVETAQRAGFEMVCTLVFRGSRDIPFWETFKDAPTEAADRARVINEMLQAQVDVVREVTGDPAPNLRTTFSVSSLFSVGRGQFEVPGGEVKHGAEVLGRAEAAGLALDGGEDAVEPLPEGIGRAAEPVRHDALKVSLDHLGGFHHRREQRGRVLARGPAAPGAQFAPGRGGVRNRVDGLQDQPHRV